MGFGRIIPGACIGSSGVWIIYLCPYGFGLFFSYIFEELPHGFEFSVVASNLMRLSCFFVRFVLVFCRVIASPGLRVLFICRGKEQSPILSCTASTELTLESVMILGNSSAICADWVLYLLYLIDPRHLHLHFLALSFPWTSSLCFMHRSFDSLLKMV